MGKEKMHCLTDAKKIIQEVIKENEYTHEEVKKIIDDLMADVRGRKSRIVSTEEALKDVVPFDWSEDVVSGEKKIEVK